MSKLITSVNNDQVIIWSKLKQSKYQKKLQMYIIEGRHIIDEALKANLELEIIVTEESGLGGDYIVSNAVMKKISQNESSNDIVAIVKMSDIDRPLGNKVVYLDNIQDPGNAGTIIRTALAFGYDTVVLSEGVNRYNHKLINASKGAVFNINIVSSLQLNAVSDDYQIIGTLIDESAHALDSIVPSEKMIVIFGNEGVGISDDIIALLDHKVYIPMHNFDSLNVGITAGIILYHLK